MIIYTFSQSNAGLATSFVREVSVVFCSGKRHHLVCYIAQCLGPDYVVCWHIACQSSPLSCSEWHYTSDLYWIYTYPYYIIWSIGLQICIQVKHVFVKKENFPFWRLDWLRVYFILFVCLHVYTHVMHIRWDWIMVIPQPLIFLLGLMYQINKHPYDILTYENWNCLSTVNVFSNGLWIFQIRLPSRLIVLRLDA